MTVGDLIAELSDMPEDTPVLFESDTVGDLSPAFVTFWRCQSQSTRGRRCVIVSAGGTEKWYAVKS